MMNIPSHIYPSLSMTTCSFLSLSLCFYFQFSYGPICIMVRMHLLYSHHHDQLYKHIHIYIYICMQNHSDDIIITGDTVLRKIYLSLYLKGGG